MFLRIPARRPSVPSDPHQRPTKPLRRPFNNNATLPTQAAPPSVFVSISTPMRAPMPLLAPCLSIASRDPYAVMDIEMVSDYDMDIYEEPDQDVEMGEPEEDVQLGGPAVTVTGQVVESELMDFEYTPYRFSFTEMADTLMMLDDSSSYDSEPELEDEAVEDDDDNDDWYEVDEAPAPISPTPSFNAWHSLKRTFSPRLRGVRCL